MPEASFTANAYIHGGRWQHHRLRDHFGVESDLYVVLSSRIGPWIEGTPVHFVIDDLIARLNSLESADHVLGQVTANAYLLAPGSVVETPAGTWRGIFSADAIASKAISGSTIARAWIVGGGTFTVNANIRGQQSFTADAVLA
jgi:hypothetical protein